MKTSQKNLRDLKDSNGEVKECNILVDQSPKNFTSTVNTSRCKMEEVYLGWRCYHDYSFSLEMLISEVVENSCYI